jgi:hypothetical protein
MDTPMYRRENYCKFNRVHKKLIDYLEDGVSAKLTAKDLDISIATYYKYKSMISIEKNKIYKVQEEIDFLDRQNKRKEESLLSRDKKDIKDTSVKNSSTTSTQSAKDEKINHISTQPVQNNPDTKVLDKGNSQ